MKEEKHIRKLKTTLHHIHITITLWDKEKTCIGVIRERAESSKKIDKDLLKRTRYYVYKAYIDAINLIDKYNISEEVVKKLYFIEDNKRVSFSKTKNIQKPITFRDNKDIHIGNGGSGSNKVRYPSKKRPLSTWRRFYKLFPYYAERDNFDGKTSDKMK